MTLRGGLWAAYTYALVLAAAFACGEGQCPCESIIKCYRRQHRFPPPAPVPSPIATSLAAYTQINTEARLHCDFPCMHIYPTWEKLSTNWMSIRDNNSISGYVSLLFMRRDKLIAKFSVTTLLQTMIYTFPMWMTALLERIAALQALMVQRHRLTCTATMSRLQC